MTWKDLKFAENLLSSFFQLKYESFIHNIAFFSENAISSESREKYAQIKHKQKPLKQICQWVLMWEGNRRWFFLLGK